MRGVRFTKDEVLAITYGMDHIRMGGGRLSKAADTVMAKLDAAKSAPPNVAIGPIEDALVNTSEGKVVPLAGGHSRASVQATSVGATEASAQVIGKWMARQGWLKGPQTVIDVLNKWHQWLAKATATEPPAGTAPGFTGTTSANTGHGPAGPSQKPQGRRPACGFR